VAFFFIDSPRGSLYLQNRLTGREFRAIRLRLGLTQGALAKRRGIERTTIYRWEHGKFPITKMAALAVQQLDAEARGRASRSRG